MATASEIPTLNMAAGARVLAADLPRVLAARGHKNVEEAGWEQKGKNALLIPLTAAKDGVTDHYLLKLAFLTDRDWPPSAQFVNPKTLKYDPTCDYSHLPNVNVGYLQTHKDYAYEGSKMQLICCSVTLEFYQVKHGVEPHHVWQDGSTFLNTLDAIESALASPRYEGRFK